MEIKRTSWHYKIWRQIYPLADRVYTPSSCEYMMIIGMAILLALALITLATLLIITHIHLWMTRNWIPLIAMTIFMMFVVGLIVMFSRKHLREKYCKPIEFK